MAAKPRRSSEKSLQTSVLKYLRTLPCGFFENRSPGPYTKSGVADITGTWYGRSIAIELKAPSKPPTPSPAQQAYLEAVKHAGGFVLVANKLDTVKWFIQNVREVIDAS